MLLSINMYIVIGVINMLAFFFVIEDKSLNIVAALGRIFIRRINSKEIFFSSWTPTKRESRFLPAWAL